MGEAFMDCQAVQARAVEKTGLQLLGLTLDLKGLLVHLIDEYKVWAIKELATERIQKLNLSEDENPVHYENRLTADLGDLLGLNAADVRRARLDQHALSRFRSISGTREAEKVANRCRELF